MILSTNIVKRSKPIILFLLLLPSIIWGLTFVQGDLGINPIDKLMDEFGKMALRLIIFTLMIFSVLNGIQDVTTEQPQRVTGGYDIKATITPDLPITGDVRSSLNMSDFEVVSGASNVRVEVKEFEGENNTYKGAKLVSLEDEFLDSTLWEMAHFDPNYGSTDREIWQALMSDKTLVVANATIIIIIMNNTSNPPKIKNNIMHMMTNTFLKVNFISKSTKNHPTMCGRHIYSYFLKFNDNMGDFINVVLVLITPLLILIFFMWRNRK